MRKFLKIFSLVAVALVCGCGPEPNEIVTGYGDLDITLSVDTTVRAVAGAPALSVVTVPEDKFVIEAENRNTGYRKTWRTIDEFRSGTRKLPVGEYVFRTSAGDVRAEGFDLADAFAGERIVHIGESSFTLVDMPCRVAGTYVSVDCTERASALFGKLSVRMKSSSGGYVEFAGSAGRPARLKAGRIAGELTVADGSGREVTLRPFEMSARDGEHHQLRLDATTEGASPVLTAVYDDATLDCPWTLKIDESLFSGQAPEASAFGFADGTLSLCEHHAPVEPAGFSVSALSGLSHLYLTVVSPVAGEAFSEETDLLAFDATALAEQGIEAEGCVVGSTNVRVDLSGLIARFSADGEQAAARRIVVQAADASGRLVPKPLTLSVESRPMVITLGEPKAVALSSGEAVLEVTTSGASPETDLAFEYHDYLSGEWIAAPVISVASSGAGNYQVTVAVPEGLDRLSLRAVTMDGHKTSNVVVLHRIVPKFDVACRAENIWSSRADLIVTCADLHGIVPYLTVYVSEQGGDWHPAVTERSPEEGRITVKTLMPTKSYRVRVYAGDEYRVELAFTTEAALALPNAEFEEVRQTISMQNVNCGGKYSNLGSWMPIYNKVNIEASEPEGWASVNAKTCSPYAKVSNSWFQVPTTEVVRRAYSGQYAVRLRNAAWDINGVEPPRDARTDREYYSSKEPVLTHRSAGKLFLGSYAFDAAGKETYQEGIPFTSRPTALSGMYSYVQSLTDFGESGLVEVQVLHEENGKREVIGRGRSLLSPSTSFTRFVVPVVYSVRNKRATHLCVLISSSSYACCNQSEESRLIHTDNYLQPAVSTGAQLTVDHLSLLYE